MKHELSNSPKSPGPEPSCQGDFPSSPPIQDVGEKATVSEDVKDVSDAGQSAHTTRATNGEAGLLSLDGDNNAIGEMPSKNAEEQEKEKAINTNDHVSGYASSLPPRPISWPPGWGRNPEEDTLHVVPESHGGPQRQRAVFRVWPRDQKGRDFTPSEPRKGTLSPGGYPWGATLYDFYSVNMMPPCNPAKTIMSGSELWETMKELGELDAAKSEIEWAKSEGKPSIEDVVDTARSIKRTEFILQYGLYNHTSMLDSVRKTALKKWIYREGGVKQAPGNDNGVGKDSDDEDHEADYEEAAERGNEAGSKDKGDMEHDTEVDLTSIPPPPIIPITSPFHPTHYPKPWPFIPFENPYSVVLQERLPLYLLPQTLYVHDPFNLLPAHERRPRDTSWISRPDVVRTYNLKVSGYVHEEVEEARRKAEELEEYRAHTLLILRYKRTREQIENHEPVIEIPLPFYPRRMTKVEESHLYLSPVAKVGQGHHSIVYKGEWELPRDLFARQEPCEQCFKASVDKEIQKLKDTGRWEKMLKTAGWGPVDIAGCQPKQAELDEVNDTISPERDEGIEREIVCIVPPNLPPSLIHQILDGNNIWNTFMQQEDCTSLELDLTKHGDDNEPTTGSSVIRIRVDPTLSYESREPCIHGLHRSAVPRAAKFTVVAKLSIENDHHLAREARNYQQFPEHFFHNYNGYAIIRQLRTIVPVSAVVPQFYGHYMPKKDQTEKQGEEPYLSPILLLECCGDAIEPEKLSDEDQDECASLLLRFQSAGWLHQSVAPRNFLFQLKERTDFLGTRRGHPESSFRLIDFGRSRKVETTEEKEEEERRAWKVFEKLTCMNS